jgi:hypothetical protein
MLNEILNAPEIIHFWGKNSFFLQITIALKSLYPSICCKHSTELSGRQQMTKSLSVQYPHG